MIVSSALPIQFWPSSKQTYNEKEVCGIDPVCWCQPVQCDDTIGIQITDVADPDFYFVAIMDADGLFVFDEGFGSNGTKNIVPSDEEICDGEFQFYIYHNSDQDVQTLELADYWSDVGIVPFTNKSDDFFETTLTSTSQNSQAQHAFNAPLGARYFIDVVITITGKTNTASLIAVIQPVGGNVLNDASEYTFTENGVYNRTFEIEVAADPQTVMTAIITLDSNTGAPITIRMAYDPDQIIYINQTPSSQFYRSDCVDIREEHECTEVITYSNSRDFAGINYDVTSPVLELHLRVPTVFFHESFPREDEVHPLSDDTYKRLSSSVTRKKQIDFGFMPDYMIQKLNLILMHDFIEIDGEEWVLQDPYEKTESNNRRYPLHKSTALLTDKNFIERNLI